MKLLLALATSAPALVVISSAHAQSAPPQMAYYAGRQVQQIPAQPVYYQQQQPSRGGGGLLEYLFSGAQQPQSYGQQGYYQQQQQYQQAPQQGLLPAMPMEQQQQAYEPVTPAQPEMDPRFEKREVEYRTSEAPGTIVIDTPSKYLYLVQGDGRAMRYGIGVGKPGFAWAGVKHISMKREWPDWTPPAEMLQRRPDLPRHMVGGPENPLGARAMYLGSTLYRIHGSNEPWTIGTAVSSGCIRMRNEDVIDLYGRVKVGTKVIVS